MQWYATIVCSSLTFVLRLGLLQVLAEYLNKVLVLTTIWYMHCINVIDQLLLEMLSINRV